MGLHRARLSRRKDGGKELVKGGANQRTPREKEKEPWVPDEFNPKSERRRGLDDGSWLSGRSSDLPSAFAVAQSSHRTKREFSRMSQAG